MLLYMDREGSEFPLKIQSMGVGMSYSLSHDKYIMPIIISATST